MTPRDGVIPPALIGDGDGEAISHGEGEAIAQKDETKLREKTRCCKIQRHGIISSETVNQENLLNCFALSSYVSTTVRLKLLCFILLKGFKLF